MKNKIKKAKQARKNRAFQARNILLTSSRDFADVGEWGVLNPRRHKTIQKLAEENSKPKLRKILLADKELDNGIAK